MNMAARFSDQLDERPEWIEPSLRTMIEAGRRLSGLEVGRAQVARTAFYNQAQQFMERYDLLLTPQMPCVAWPAERASTDADESIFDHLPFTFPFNGTGWPAASVPCGFNAEGIADWPADRGAWRQDDLCLRAAAAFEAIQPWHARRPL